MRNPILFWVLGLILFSGVARATSVGPGDPYVTALGDAFDSALPSTWSHLQGGWEYFNVDTCFIGSGVYRTPTCFGNNPSSPYGYPVFSENGGTPTNVFQMNPSDAVVIFLKTPPSMAYYGFSQYLALEGSKMVFASLSDTLNMLEFRTLGSGAVGQNLFNQYAVIVWTADMDTLASVETTLAGLGVPASQVNFIPLPINMGTYPGWTEAPLPPLNMGMSASSDGFTMLMRTALPASPSDLQAYIQEVPYFVTKVGPATPVTPTGSSAAPTTGYAPETTGISEATSSQSQTQLQAALNSLVSDIKGAFGTQFTFAVQTVTDVSQIGWDCIAAGKNCNGDNHDALYSQDTTKSVVKLTNLNDVVLVIGVNHALTNKALYVNHTVYDVVNQAGIVSVTNQTFVPASALYWAGVTNPSDPRVAEYQSLYAYAISYDCTGLQYCQQIPAPTSTNPVGLRPGADFSLFGRVYVDPVRATAPLNVFVRPSPAEIVTHQTLIGTRKAN